MRLQKNLPRSLAILQFHIVLYYTQSYNAAIYQSDRYSILSSYPVQVYLNKMCATDVAMPGCSLQLDNL